MFDELNLITEEDSVEYTKDSDLSYENKGELVELFVEDFYVGDVKVYLDSEMDGREYICLNYTIVYLDTLKTKIPKNN